MPGYETGGAFDASSQPSVGYAQGRKGGGDVTSDRQRDSIKRGWKGQEIYVLSEQRRWPDGKNK